MSDATPAQAAPKRKPEFWEAMQPPPVFRHFRMINEDTFETFPNGGSTVAWRYFPSADQVHLAIAFCNDVDNFEKAKGRVLSAGRLLSPRRVVVTVDAAYRELQGKELRKALAALVDEFESREYAAWHVRRGLDPLK